MSPDQCARALRLADVLKAPMGEAGKTGYATQHEVADFLCELAAEPERVPMTWQPIETAPKDGRKVILFYLNRNGKARTVMARWLTDEQAAECDEDAVGLEEGWYECIDNWDDYTQVAIYEGEPTHWMPLPEPPASITGDAK